MDITELVSTLKQRKIGLAYELWKQALLNRLILANDFPKNPEEASPELYPPRKAYKMYDFLKQGSRKGEIKNGQ